MPEASSPLALDVAVRGAALDILTINHSRQPMRVWDRSNSWGWETLALELGVSRRSEDCYPLTGKPIAFTRNGPGFTEIPPGGMQRVTVSAGNPEWNGIERIEHLRSQTLWVRACLRIRPSPEAETYGIFVGEVSSPRRESQPPHRWLFT